MDTQTAITQYKEALKQITRYEQLYRQADYGGKNSAKRCHHASQQRQYYEARRDEALAALQAIPDGVAWLEERERAKVAKDAREWARIRAANDLRLIDEYLYSSERMVIEHTAWRLEERFGHTAWAAEKRGEYERVKTSLEDCLRTIQERDLWKAVTRRSQQLRRQERQGRETPPPDAA